MEQRQNPSVVFEWKEEDFDALLESCTRAPELPYIIKYMPKDGKIIEAGCGLGRFVIYLSERGFNIEGIEINPVTVSIVRKKRPDVKILQGDIAHLPYPDNSISGIISLGVIEHFIEGPDLPLKEMWRVLKSGHYAIISVPSLNYLRQLKHKFGYYALKERIKRVAFIRRIFGKKPLKTKFIRRLYKFTPYFLSGEFFEYRFTRKEFEQELVRAGFEIIESVPIAQMDGLYHEFGRIFVSFQNWEFHPNFLGKFLNNLLSQIPFFHNHMHLCVVKKP
ncbi:MAG: class I SAM-dependent methyltransferase [Thermoplasmatales archaeon]